MANKKSPVLVCWIGGNDLKAAAGGLPGPILSALRAARFSRADLLCSYSHSESEAYRSWLATQTPVPLTVTQVSLTSPVDFAEIYEAAERHLRQLQSTGEPLAILLSPGTAAMQAVWILLGKTRYPSIFYQSSLEQGVQQVEIPFEIAAEYVPAASALSTTSLSHMALQATPVDAAFDNIITRNRTMLQLKQQAQVLAQKMVPVLVYGETGTGKELFARAIHNAGPRSDKPFVAVNCGAIPPELIDSTLFGHRKGAFTGATADRPGVFQQADGGTLFLDEFGELSADVQVRLLRVLQEGVFTPVGGVATAPFYATLLLLVINQLTKHRWGIKQALEYVRACGLILGELGGILAAIGLIVGALQVTGMAGTLTNDLVYIAGGNVLVLLAMGAVTSFVLGIGMSVTAAYIFLAIILAPALVGAGLDAMASHMFIMYWGMLSFITPPVALSAFAAASVAKVSAMKAGFEAMRLGTIIYFIPFFFVFNPALLMQGSWIEIAIVLSTAVIGVLFLSAALQGYLIGVGTLGSGVVGLSSRALLAASGLTLAAPGGGMLGISHAALLAVALLLLAASIALALLQRKRDGRPVQLTW